MFVCVCVEVCFDDSAIAFQPLRVVPETHVITTHPFVFPSLLFFFLSFYPPNSVLDYIFLSFTLPTPSGGKIWNSPATGAPCGGPDRALAPVSGSFSTVTVLTSAAYARSVQCVCAPMCVCACARMCPRPGPAPVPDADEGLI